MLISVSEEEAEGERGGGKWPAGQQFFLFFFLLAFVFAAATAFFLNSSPRPIFTLPLSKQAFSSVNVTNVSVLFFSFACCFGGEREREKERASLVFFCFFVDTPTAAPLSHKKNATVAAPSRQRLARRPGALDQARRGQLQQARPPRLGPRRQERLPAVP